MVSSPPPVAFCSLAFFLATIPWPQYPRSYHVGDYISRNHVRVVTFKYHSITASSVWLTLVSCDLGLRSYESNNTTQGRACEFPSAPVVTIDGLNTTAHTQCELCRLIVMPTNSHSPTAVPYARSRRSRLRSSSRFKP